MFFEVLVSLLGKNGVAIHDVNITETGDVKIDIDFSEHDKVFEDKIAEQKNEISILKAFIDSYRDAESKLFDEKQELNQRIAELKKENLRLTESVLRKETKIHDLDSKKTENPTKINLNDRIKVKLTPLGAEIYYHQYDELNKKIKANGGTQLEPIMPQIDKDGYTEFTFHHFISLYGNHIGICKPNVIEPLDIVFCE